jgi:hypothetical protein
MIFVPRPNGSVAMEMFCIDPADLQAAYHNDAASASDAEDNTGSGGVGHS